MRQTERKRTVNRVAVILVTSLLLGYTLLLLLTLLVPDFFTDLVFSQWLQQFRHPVLWSLAVALGEIGKPYFVVIKALLPALVLIFYGYRREGLFLMTTLLADAANLVLKELVNRPRPTADALDVLQQARNPGFPSGHTVNYIVYFGFLLVVLVMLKGAGGKLYKVAVAVFVVLMLLAPWSRIYTGMHWPSDIIGGGFFGIIFLAMLCYAYLHPVKKLLEE